jgi:hypothetical protein
MTNTWTTVALLSAMSLTATMRGDDSKVGIVVQLNYDYSVPPTTVYRAKALATRLFAKAGVPVAFSSHQDKRDKQPRMEFQMYIQTETLGEVNSSALARSFPFRSNGQVQIYYSRIANYNPAESRPAVLAYIMVHELTHVFQGVKRHSENGVMKETWDREDFKKIEKATLEFDQTDVVMIQNGLRARLKQPEANGVSAAGLR